MCEDPAHARARAQVCGAKRRLAQATNRSTGKPMSVVSTKNHG